MGPGATRSLAARAARGLRAVLGALLCLAPGACEDGLLHPVRFEPGPPTRDPVRWPFASTSIWNTPIGSGAARVPAGVGPVQDYWSNPSFLVRARASDPERPIHAPEGTCAGTRELGRVRLPDAFLVPEPLRANPGNSASVLLPDGRTLVQLSGFARCAPGGPVFGFPSPPVDLHGDGRLGGSGGSGLSALGGTFGPEDWRADRPIRHALKIGLHQARYYYFDPAQPGSCFRWPADRCDGFHAAGGASGYGGSNPALRMGSLLALPKDADARRWSLETTLGARLLAALRDYGAYVSTSAGKDILLLVVDHEVRPELDAWVAANRAAWLRDINRLLPRLEVIDNNAPDRIGGGGAPLAPSAPALPP